MKTVVAAAMRLPVWILLPLAIATWHVDTLWHPFDFHDDGGTIERKQDLSPESSVVWAWNRAADEAKFSGPFRPVYWLYYRLNNVAFGEDAMLWRVGRIAVLMVSAGLFVKLLVEFAVPGWLAACVAAASIVAPGRSTVWYHFCLGEAQAMPFVMGGLIAVSVANRWPNHWRWDVAAWLCIAAAALTKNVFISVLPALLVLRVWTPGGSLWSGIRRHWAAAVVLSTTALVPFAHLFHFMGEVNGRSAYKVGAPSLETCYRMCRCTATAWGVDYLGAGILLATIVVLSSSAARSRFFSSTNLPVLSASLLILVFGVAIYLPALQGEMGPAARYTIPANWGVDIAAALLLAAWIHVPAGRLRQVSIVALSAGAIAMATATLIERTKSAVGDRMIWQAALWIRDHAPPNASIATSTEFVTDGQMFHLERHLWRLGRKDIRSRNDPGAIVLSTAPAANGERLASFKAAGWSSLPQIVLKPLPKEGIALIRTPVETGVAGRPGEAPR